MIDNFAGYLLGMRRWNLFYWNCLNPAFSPVKIRMLLDFYPVASTLSTLGGLAVSSILATVININILIYKSPSVTPCLSQPSQKSYVTDSQRLILCHQTNRGGKFKCL